MSKNSNKVDSIVRRIRKEFGALELGDDELIAERQSGKILDRNDSDECIDFLIDTLRGGNERAHTLAGELEAALALTVKPVASSADQKKNEATSAPAKAPESPASITTASRMKVAHAVKLDAATSEKTSATLRPSEAVSPLSPVQDPNHGGAVREDGLGSMPVDELEKLVKRCTVPRTKSPRIKDQYSESMTEAKGYGDFPAVEVAWVNEKPQVVDGGHRILAASKAGLKRIPVKFSNLDREEYIRRACAANCRHGFPRSRLDRRKQVKLGYEFLKQKLGREPSDRAVALLTAVSPTLAGQVIAEINNPPEAPAVRTYCPLRPLARVVNRYSALPGADQDALDHLRQAIQLLNKSNPASEAEVA